MHVMASAPRAYHSPARREAAARTRQEILDAASWLFTSRGYQGTTKAAIAERAGVSLQSVNLAGPKSGLLMACFEVAFAGDEGSHSLTDRPQLVEIMSMDDWSAAIDRYLVYVAEANDRSTGIRRAMDTAAETDEAMAGLVRDLEERSRADLLIGAEWLGGRASLRPDLTVSSAADVLGVIVSAEVQQRLVVRCGWGLDAYVAWMRDAIDRLLLDPDQTGRQA